ncbi:MAG: SNF2-related protein [Ginsengibacter sp.]
MALPYLIKYVYNSGTDEVIRRGKKIHTSRFIELTDHDDLIHAVNFRVKDDTYSIYYKVSIEKYNDPKSIALRCTCPYNLSDLCRHEAAALMQLQDLINNNLLNTVEPTVYNQKHTIAPIKYIDLRMIRILAGMDNYSAAEEILRKYKCNILTAENGKVEATLDLEGELFHIIIQKNDEHNFDTSCNCDEKDHVLCRHKAALFSQMLNNWGPHYFDSIRNWDRQKNKLLESYGYSLEDDLTGKFEFIYKEGKPFLKVIDSSIKKVAASVTTKPVPQPVLSSEEEESEEQQEETVRTRPVATRRKAIALVFNGNEKLFPYLTIDVIQGSFDREENKFMGLVEKLDLTKYVNVDLFTEKEKQLIQLSRKLQDQEINKYLNRNSPFSGFWENIIHTQNEQYPEETKLLIAEFLHPKIKRLIEENEGGPVYLLPKGSKFTTKNLQEVEFSSEEPVFEFKISKEENGQLMEVILNIDGNKSDLSANEWESDLLFLENGTLHLWKSFEETLLAEKFKNRLHIPKTEWPKLLKELVLPLSDTYKVSFESSHIKEVKEGQPDISVTLIEKGDYLLFQPTFTYQGFSVKANDKDTVIVPENDKVLMVHRNKEAEEEFVSKLNSLHSQFSRQDQTRSLVLKGADVLKNNWFFLFVDAMKEMKIPIFGFESLKNFKFNTTKPSTRIQLSSGVDWFDAKVELSFGDQHIGIAEIQKALANKQSFVQLDDGSLGILPDEWIKKYSLLFKVGEGNKNQLRLSKYHLSVIDDLYEQRDEEELLFKLDEKYERLREFKSIPEVPAPADLENRLRPYQIAGFQWLNYLNTVGWGGILADDMGLGKTVQSLTMLKSFAEREGTLTALVICPTTLIYNWENEIKKFTPELTYQIHHGNTRSRKREELLGKNIIITTYGTLRSDIHLFMKIRFDYAMLDESQAIKNPFSKITKAAGLLDAVNKVCMSGTPLQNNTFDIYAQMNFLNPGLLGSVEFFRNEFSTPIDKFGEKEQKDHLRKLLYPFILRRTKEQVAKDLPEKTETVLYCEMGDAQRAVYESFRHAYRDKIMGVIDDQGVGKSQLTILQGLMKLRQICDSPAILNEEESYPNDSIKLDELTREITENIGDHKALVFSQFLGMLGLIREKLKKNNIEFEYFDGSTPPHERERAIQNFQNNENCRVFLISLKAGGVGLNLTAADYVYIVDPWWNPAVEQQAIDRTHRIGQTKNIFAYRMICKDTIEDKIMQLQEKKRTLAKELIGDDQSFVKGLSKEDVEYLFS